MPIPVVDQTVCIGCGLCTEIASHTFRLDAGGHSSVVDPAGDDEGTIQEAIDSCPESAISWE